MPLSPFSIETFGGLVFSSDPIEVGPVNAIDGLNFDIDRRGRVRSRSGTAIVNDSSFSGNLWRWFTTYPTSTIFGHLIVITVTNAGAGKFDRILPETGSTRVNIGTIAGTTTDYRVASSTVFGTPSTTQLFWTSWADRSTGFDMWQYNGATIGTATAGKPLYVTTMPRSNRLVQAHYVAAADTPSGANGTSSTVFFSDAGAPTTYTGGTNWVKLMPGDGEDIVGAVTWDERVHVFKQTRLFEFYGESVDTTGNPIFNYRVINLPTKLPGRVSSSGSTPGNLEFPHVISTLDGIYFANRQGVWRYRGRSFERVSAPIEYAIFTDDPAFGDRVLDSPILSWANGRLFAYYQRASDNAKRVLVYNSELSYWTIWDQFERAADYPSGFAARDVAFFAVTPSADTPAVYRMRSDATNDNGVAINSYYQSGFYDMGPKGADVFTRWSRLWGYGTPTFSIFTDMGTTDGNAGAVTLGTSPAVAEGYHLKQYKGMLFSHKISAASGIWSVSRLQHDITSIRP